MGKGLVEHCHRLNVRAALTVSRGADSKADSKQSSTIADHRGCLIYMTEEQQLQRCQWAAAR